jgi:hypothetical protein
MYFYVVRAFVQLRELSLTQQDVAAELAELDDKPEAKSEPAETLLPITRLSQGPNP